MKNALFTPCAQPENIHTQPHRIVPFPLLFHCIYFDKYIVFIVNGLNPGVSVVRIVIVQVRVVLKKTVVGDQSFNNLSYGELQSTENFIDAIKEVQIPDNYKFVSFDVKSLFTSTPLQLALQCTETAIQQSTVKLLLPTR